MEINLGTHITLSGKGEKGEFLFFIPSNSDIQECENMLSYFKESMRRIQEQATDMTQQQTTEDKDQQAQKEE